MDWEADERGSKQVAAIAKALKGARTLYLATDPDREGEAISWHVRAMLDEKRALKRRGRPAHHLQRDHPQRHPRTRWRSPRDLDQPLIEAYLARRALDYLVGFTLSPVLWRKLPGSRSAGRVQSVALRLVCEREAEIEAFRAREYWTVEALFTTPAGAPFTARLTHLDGKQARPVRSAGRGDRAARQGRGRGRAASPSARSSASGSSATRRRPSPPPPCSRKPRASSASARRRRCGSRSSSMRASISRARRSASSPTCGPTACRWRARRCSPSATTSRTATGRTTCPRRRANTPAGRRTRRRRTRRSVRPTWPAPRRASPVISTRTSAAFTSWSGSAPSPRRCNRPNSTRSASR